MGEADRTTNVGNVVLRLYNSYQKKCSKIFVEDITE